MKLKVMVSAVASIAVDKGSSIIAESAGDLFYKARMGIKMTGIIRTVNFIPNISNFKIHKLVHVV